MDNNTIYGRGILTNRDKYSTLPPRITAFTAEAGDGKATVSFRAYTEEHEQWLSANAPYILVLKANAVPQSPEDGMVAKINHVRGAMLSHTFTGLTNETVYYARLYPINFKGRAQSTLVDQVVSVVPMGMPSAATNLKVVGSGKSATCTWTNPTQSTFYRSVLVRKAGSAPTSITDGTELYRGTGTSYTVSSLELNKTYYFAVFAINSSGSYKNDFPTAKYTTPAYIEEVLYENGQDPSGLTDGFLGNQAITYGDSGDYNYNYTAYHNGTSWMLLWGEGPVISVAATNKAIDFTNISKVIITYELTISGNWLNYGALMTLTDGRYAYNLKDFFNTPGFLSLPYFVRNIENTAMSGTCSMDTSSVTGNKHLTFGCSVGYSNSRGDFWIKKIIIHKTK